MTKYQRAKRRIARDRSAKSSRHKDLYRNNDNFNSVVSMQNMCHALSKCQKGVNWKSTVQDYTEHAITEMYAAFSSLHNGKLPDLENTRKLILYERGKRREIVPVSIRDRIIQRVICDHALIPVIKNRLIYDNGASIKGKGISFTRKRLIYHLHLAVKEYGTEFYALTFDFKSFFDNISHQICLDILKENFNDKYIQGLTLAILKSYEKVRLHDITDKSLREKQLQILNENHSKGICLGSQVSQIMALAVPDKLDHFIKDMCGIKHYLRYMDDGIIFHNNKDFLRHLLEKMKEICNHLGLTFHDKKTKIVKISRGFVFMKICYRVSSTGKIIRTLTRNGIVRMRRKLKKFNGLVKEGRLSLDDVYNSMQAWLSYSKAALSYHTKRSMLKLYNQLFDGYRITRKWEHKNITIPRNDKWSEFRWNYAA